MVEVPVITGHQDMPMERDSLKKYLTSLTGKQKAAKILRQAWPKPFENIILCSVSRFSSRLSLCATQLLGELVQAWAPTCSRGYQNATPRNWFKLTACSLTWQSQGNWMSWLAYWLVELFMCIYLYIQWCRCSALQLVANTEEADIECRLRCGLG